MTPKRTSLCVPALVILAFAVGFPGWAVASRVHVDAGAAPGGDGASWGSALVDLQDALDMARSDGSEIDEIWVAVGTYRPDRGTGELASTFELVDGVAIYGNFEGWETSVDERVPLTFGTILSGDLAGDDDDVEGGTQDNCYNVVRCYLVGADTVIDGLVIKGGYAFGAGIVHDRGGGMYAEEGCPTIRNCAFSDNHALYGGGLCANGSDPVVVDCYFDGNFAVLSGGAIYNYNATATVIGGYFGSNHCDIQGGAVYEQNGNSTYWRCTFLGNRAEQGAGVNCLYGIACFDQCWFLLNEATSGGGLYSGSAQIDLTACRFESNSATGSRGGGVSHNGIAPANATDCVFLHNTAEQGGGLGVFSEMSLTNCGLFGNQATRDGGGIYAIRPLSMDNCVISGNESAEDGGGVYAYSYAALDIVNSVFSQNAAERYGGGLTTYLSDYPIEIKNTIFWGNTCEGISGGQEGQIFWQGDTPSASYCCIRGLWDYLGEGNITQDPMFADPDGPDGFAGTLDDDYHLLPGSPCIDAGDPLFEATPGVGDIDGHFRVICNRVDMGADETGLGDGDCDGSVDLDDHATFDACMNGPDEVYSAGCEAFDSDADGDLDLVDFAAFQVVMGVQ